VGGLSKLPKGFFHNLGLVGKKGSQLEGFVNTPTRVRVFRRAIFNFGCPLPQEKLGIISSFWGLNEGRENWCPPFFN